MPAFIAHPRSPKSAITGKPKMFSWKRADCCTSSTTAIPTTSKVNSTIHTQTLVSRHATQWVAM